MQRLSPFRLMNTLFLGLGLSVAYGVVSAGVLWVLGGRPEAIAFAEAYTTSFRTLVSFGLIIGTALIVFRSQNIIPETIEAAFTSEQLSDTDYRLYKRRFVSRRRSVTFAAQFVVIAFVIFSYSQFPLPRRAEIAMVIVACAQYGLGVYVGRKLCYAGMMLHSLLDASVTRNLFKRRELDDIDSYVHIASTLTVVFVFLHVLGYYDGPFLYGSVLGRSLKPFLLLPAIIATPVLLIFNFYPRMVLKKIYGESIDVELKNLQKVLTSESLRPYEKRSYLIAFDKMAREELRNSLQLTLSDLPIALTIVMMVLQSLLKR
jgi:hypothetical protein